MLTYITIQYSCISPTVCRIVMAVVACRPIKSAIHFFFNFSNYGCFNFYSSQHVCVCVCVCFCMCVCVCMYVCVYVCKYVCITVFVVRRRLTLWICNTFPCIVPSFVKFWQFISILRHFQIIFKAVLILFYIIFSHVLAAWIIKFTKKFRCLLSKTFCIWSNRVLLFFISGVQWSISSS